MTQPPGDPGAAGQTTAPTCYRHPDRETYVRCQRCGRPICPECMRSAAVGFQCPDCVAEGARTTRQARTAYGGLRPSNAGLTTYVLMGLNLLVWLAIQATGGYRSRLLDALALTPVGRCVDGAGYYPTVTDRTVCSAATGGDWVPGVVTGAPWQLLTNAFTHVEIWHIGVNMIALYALGPQLELVLGRARFLALYLLSALAGSTLVLWSAGATSQTVGASGALFGLMGAFLVVAWKVRGNVQQILVWLALNAVTTVTIPRISWEGHVGGFVGGLVCAAILVYAPRGRRTGVQAAGLAGVGVLLVLACLVRAIALTG